VLDFIYELKTSALIESSMMIGAILAGADTATIKDMEIIAKNVGIAFQIQDDILDVTSTAEVLGKPIMSDEKNEKTTYVTLVGLEKAKEYVEKISLDAIELLHGFQANDLFLEQLLKSLIHREK
jgi:geranylgeranyl diphosphate synthase type II